MRSRRMERGFVSLTSGQQDEMLTELERAIRSVLRACSHARDRGHVRRSGLGRQCRTCRLGGCSDTRDRGSCGPGKSSNWGTSDDRPAGADRRRPDRARRCGRDRGARPHRGRARGGRAGGGTSARRRSDDARRDPERHPQLDGSAEGEGRGADLAHERRRSRRDPLRGRC